MTRLLALLLLSCVSVAYSHAASADSRPLFLAGSEYSPGNAYSHAGIITPLSGGTLQQGYNVPVFVYLVEYSYTTTQNNRPVTVRAKVPGVRAGLGYQWTAGDASLGWSASLAYQNTHQSPYIPATGTQGGAVILLPQAHLNYRLTPQTSADLMANYSIGQSAYWSHFRLAQQLADTWRIGPELGLQGGKNYRAGKAGVFAATGLSNGMTVEMNGGVLAAAAQPFRLYVGLAVSSSF